MSTRVSLAGGLAVGAAGVCLVLARANSTTTVRFDGAKVPTGSSTNSADYVVLTMNRGPL